MDILFLAALSVYALAGVVLAPFHGDEPMLLYASSDYITAFLDGSPQLLTTTPPYFIDSDAHLRILNGSVSRYSIGLVWHASGYGRSDLPPAPGWDWGRGYEDNLAGGRRPTEQHLVLARLPSIAYLAASFAAMFALAQALGGRTLAYIATALYALHPAILLNGRRVMQESMVLCFGLLALYIAVHIVKHLSTQKPQHRSTDSSRITHYTLFILLALACGLTLASKHSGVVFVVGALGIVLTGYVFAAWQQRERRTSLLLSGASLTGASGVLAIALFIALSPGLWNDPPARLGDLLAVRAELLDIQTVAAGGAMSNEQRIEKLFTQPFVAPLMYYETQVFAVAPIQAEITRYEASGLSGVHWGIGGLLLTLAAAGGIIASLIMTVRPFESSALAVGMLMVLTVIVASLLANPLPWQRYYLALTTLACLYAAAGLVALFGYTSQAINGSAAPQSRSAAGSQ
ncbi:MAG: phospholipid carrier-dependent glycosyltransferase [Chloroflexota bacterium]|nr:phospholipid carrier-dependent glycosyltransferase [Chloroflexota bacterium]